MSPHRLLVITALTAGLAGCSTAAQPAGEPATTATPSSSPAADPTAGLPAPTLPANFSTPPMTERQAALHAWITAMNEYDYYLVGEPVQALKNAERLCLEIRENKTNAESEQLAAKLFKTNQEKAAEVVAITKSTLCPDR